MGPSGECVHREILARAREAAGGDPVLLGAVEYLFSAPSETSVCAFADRWRGEPGKAAKILCLFLWDRKAGSSARAAAACVLGECRQRSMAPQMIPLLADPDPLVRNQVGWALGELGDASLLPEIAPMLDSPDWGTRRATVLALNLIRSNAARAS